MKKNQDLKDILEKTFGKFCIPRIKKISKCRLRREIMNIAITEAWSNSSDTEKGKIEVGPAILFAPESAVDS